MSWEKKTLDRLGCVSRGKSKHRPRNDPRLFGGQYPFIQTADVKNANFYITEYSDTYNEVGLAQSKLWDVGTLCITIAANIADTGILGIPACFPDSIMGFIPYDGISDVRFVKYCFDMLQRDFKQISQGTAQDNLSWQKLSTIEFPAPPIETQRRIADILSAYDDLIENNRKQIKLLEEAAQRLYKEWFVDLRFPGHEHTKIVDGVPEGWERKPIDDVFIIKYGKTLPTSKITKSGAYPVYGANGVIGFYKEKTCDEYITVITSRGNGSGDVLRTYHKEAFITNNSFTVIPIREYDYCKVQYTYYLMKSLNFKSICTGSAQPQLTNSSISTLILILPAKEIINVFCDMAEPFFYKINILMEQIERITQARDRLLPKLMSGEVEV